MNRCFLPVSFALLFLAPAALADWFQLKYADTGAYIAHARVEIHGEELVVVYTDFFGRFEVVLPPGGYLAFVMQDGWRQEFHIDVDGREVVKVRRLVR